MSSVTETAVLVGLVSVVFSERRYLLSPVRLSVCLSVCLSTVTLVHPTQAVQIFVNVSTALGTLANR